MFGHYSQLKRNKALMIYVPMHGNNMTKIEIKWMKIKRLIVGKCQRF